MANALIVRPRSDLLLPTNAGRAAQYVRMSTDHQRYSTQNQAAAIAVYAAQHEPVIVRTYADEGRSGLRSVMPFSIATAFPTAEPASSLCRRARTNPNRGISASGCRSRSGRPRSKPRPTNPVRKSSPGLIRRSAPAE